MHCLAATLQTFPKVVFWSVLYSKVHTIKAKSRSRPSLPHKTSVGGYTEISDMEIHVEIVKIIQLNTCTVGWIFSKCKARLHGGGAHRWVGPSSQTIIGLLDRPQVDFSYRHQFLPCLALDSYSYRFTNSQLNSIWNSPGLSAQLCKFLAILARKGKTLLS